MNEQPKNMKALFYNYPWAMDVPGGGERQMLAYRHYLPQFGVQADLYDMWNPALDDYQIFHAFSVMPGVIEMSDYAKRRGLKLVVSTNLWMTQSTKQDYPFKQIWNLLQLADKVIVNSDTEGNVLSDVFSMDRGKFHTVYNAAEPDFTIPCHPQKFRDTFGIDSPYVLNVANIEPRKNQLRFIEILREERPDLMIVIAGKIRDFAYGNACIEAGGDKLRIIGSVPYASEMLRSAMNGCAFFAMPSLLETPSIAAIEASAMGAKILLTEVGSTREYFGDSVTYVNPTSTESMRTAIRSIETASNAGSVWAAHTRFIWPMVMPDLVRCYQSLF